MKKIISVAFVVAAALASSAASAGDSIQRFPIAGAMSANQADTRLSGHVQFFFAGQDTPAVLTKLVTDKTSQRTNGFLKGAERTCNYVFLSAMLRLKARAQELGADAVVNIVSNFNDNEFASATEFECAVGGLMSGVALKGDFVKLQK